MSSETRTIILPNDSLMQILRAAVVLVLRWIAVGIGSLAALAIVGMIQILVLTLADKVQVYPLVTIIVINVSIIGVGVWGLLRHLRSSVRPQRGNYRGDHEAVQKRDVPTSKPKESFASFVRSRRSGQSRTARSQDARTQASVPARTPSNPVPDLIFMIIRKPKAKEDRR